MNFQSAPTTVNICVSVIKMKYIPRLAACWRDIHTLFRDWFFPIFPPSEKKISDLSQQTTMQKKGLLSLIIVLNCTTTLF